MRTSEDREIQAKLRDLKKELERNEELMCQAAISYEDLVAAKETLSSTIMELKKRQAEMRQGRQSQQGSDPFGDQSIVPSPS